MKTNKVLIALMLGIMAVVAVSCSKDDDPVVIESTFVNSGMEADVKEASTPEGTELSYRSWIVVDQVFAKTRSADSDKVSTRASGSGTEISVMLTNNLRHIKDTISVNHFKIAANPIVTRETRVGDSYPEGNYITITDSILVYKVDYGSFVETYELGYQVATYNDGVNRFRLPHKPYEGFNATKYVLEDIDSKRGEDGRAFSQKLFTQALKVDFNSKEYIVNSTVLLRRIIETNGNPFVVRSEVLSKSIELISNDGFGAEFLSKLKVKQVWSDGRTEVNEYPARIAAEIHGDMNEYRLNENVLDPTVQDIEVSVPNQNDPASYPNENDYGTVFQNVGELTISYPQWNANFRLSEMGAFYDDGVTYQEYEAPKFDVKKITIISDGIDPVENDPGFFKQDVMIEAEVCGTKLSATAYVTFNTK